MEILEIAKIAVIIISIILAIIIIIKKYHLKLFFSILIILDILIMFELYFGTIFVKPEIHLYGEESITVEVNTEYNDPSAYATHHKRDISNKMEITNNVDITKLGTYEIIYKVKVFYTEIYKTRIVNVVDTTPPVLELYGVQDIKIIEGREFYEDGYIATDNYDGDITSKIVVEKEQITPTQFKMNYKVIDSSNNESYAYRVIDVLPKSKPEDANKNGVIYLTFDDGPSLDITPGILDILKEEEIKATFFILNFEGPEQEEIVRRIVAE